MESSDSSGDNAAVNGEPALGDQKFNQLLNQSLPSDETVVREDMVSTAVHFLLNPRVISSPLSQKRAFLRRKGLNDGEIDLAIDRSNGLTFAKHSDGHSLPPLPPQPPPVYAQPPNPSFLIRGANAATSMALFGGFLYGAYILYKRFVEPILFGRKERQHRHPLVVIQEQLDQLTSAMSALQTNVASVEAIVAKQVESQLETIRTTQSDVSLHELKTELASIKALLLNRRQFAATPIATIPMWQLDSSADKDRVQDKSVVNGETGQQMNGSDLSNGGHDSDSGDHCNEKSIAINGLIVDEMKANGEANSMFD